jgi:hypothetical protein
MSSCQPFNSGMRPNCGLQRTSLRSAAEAAVRYADRLRFCREET